MNTHGFPSCCGARILTGFYGPEQSIRDNLKQQLAAGGKKAFRFAILSQNQRKRVDPILREFGFRCVSVGRTAGGRPLYAYLLTDTTRQPKPKKKKPAVKKTQARRKLARTRSSYEHDIEVDRRR